MHEGMTTRSLKRLAWLKGVAGLRAVEFVRNSLWIQAGLALVIHSWVWLWVMGLGNLPLAAYEQPILSWELIMNPGRRAIVTVIGLVLVLIRKQTRWSDLDLGRHSRLFIMAAAALLVWPFSTVDYNFFFDQGYMLDRIILIGLWALIYVHPLFAAPTLLVLTMVIGQLNHPLADAHWHWPDKRLPFDFLVMFCSFLVLRPFFRRNRQAFILLTLTVVGSHYFHAGLNKMLLGPHLWSWATQNHLSHMLVGAYVNGGWLRPLSESTIHQLANWLSVVDPLLAAVTLMVECSVILLLLHRRLTSWILIASAGMHVGILSLTGIFFWKWILFNLMLAVWLWKSWVPDDFVGSGQATIASDTTHTGSVHRWLLRRGLFSAHAFVLFVVLVIASKPYVRNVAFAWWDTPYVNFFEIRGVGASGNEYVLDSRFFSPYDMLIQQARFYYLKKHGMIGGTYAVAHNYEFAQAVERATPRDMEAIREQFAESYDPAIASHAGSLALFVARYVDNVTRHGRKQWWLNRFAPPYHFQTWRPKDAYDLQEPLRDVYVQHLEFLDWQGQLHDVGSERVLAIPLK